MSKFSNILVTGGAGYIGSVLTRKLVLSKYNVSVLDSLIFGQDGISDLVSNNSVKLFVDDIRNKKTITDVLKDVDCVIHLAAIVGEPLCSKIPKAAKQINEFATKHIIDSCKKAGVQRFVFASTCSNYGSTLGTVNENTPLESLSLYSETKVKSEFNILNSQGENFEPCVLRFATEKHLKYLYQAYGFPAIIFRNANSYGRKYNHQFVIEGIIYQMYQGKSPIKLGDPTPYRDFIFEPDLLSAYILATESNNKKIIGESINIGTGKSLTIRQLAEKIRKITGFKGKIQWNSFPKRSLEIPKLEVDNSKARKLLNWKPKHSLDEGLKITASYYKK